MKRKLTKKPVILTPRNVVLGAIVCRGKDWDWMNQDTDTKGNRMNGEIVEVRSSNLWVSVKWEDGNENSYRIGHMGLYDLYLIKCKKPSSITNAFGYDITREKINRQNTLFSFGCGEVKVTSNELRNFLSFQNSKKYKDFEKIQNIIIRRDLDKDQVKIVINKLINKK